MCLYVYVYAQPLTLNPTNPFLKSDPLFPFRPCLSVTLFVSSMCV